MDAFFIFYQAGDISGEYKWILTSAIVPCRMWEAVAEFMDKTSKNEITGMPVASMKTWDGGSRSTAHGIHTVRKLVKGRSEKLDELEWILKKFLTLAILDRMLVSGWRLLERIMTKISILYSLSMENDLDISSSAGSFSEGDGGTERFGTNTHDATFRGKKVDSINQASISVNGYGCITELLKNSGIPS
jgi:hypothetical protein